MRTQWIYSGIMRPITVLSFAMLVGIAGCSPDGSATAVGLPHVHAPHVSHATLPGYLYVTAAAAGAGASGALYQYSVGSNGSVTPMAKASVSAGVNPAAVAADPSGHYVYVVNVGDSTVSQYTVGVGGALSPMSPAVVTNPGMTMLRFTPNAVTVDPSGRFVYVANSGDGTVSQFSIGSGGQLTPLTPATVAAGSDPVSITIDPSGSYAYVANYGIGAVAGPGTVVQYSIGVDGTLTPLNPATVSAGASPVAVTINPDGTAAYVMSNCNGSLCTGSIEQFAVGTGGVLTATGGTASTGGHYNALGMVMDQAANAYVLTNFMGVDTNNGALWQFSLDSGGALTAGNPPMLGIGPAALAQSLVGDSLFVLTWNFGIGGNAGSGGGSINRYTVGTGSLPTLADTTTLLAVNPASMVYVSGP
jgi:hypothetical protein